METDESYIIQSEVLEDKWNPREGTTMVQWMTAKQVASHLQMCKETIYDLAKKGKLPGVKIGQQWRFNRDELETWLKEKQNWETLMLTAYT